MNLPKLRIPVLGIPIIRTVVYGVYIGVPCLGALPNSYQYHGPRLIVKLAGICLGPKNTPPSQLTCKPTHGHVECAQA